MTETPATDVVRWYTRARKFPQLIGRTPDGMKLWGGPYTITQACGFGLVLFVGLNTMSLWARFGFIGNFVVLGAIATGVVFGLGRIPVGSRSPLSVASGAWRAVASPRHGRLGGRPVRLRRPHRLQHTVVMALTVLPDREPAASPAPDPRPAVLTEPSPPRRRLAGRPRTQPAGTDRSAAAQVPGDPAPALTGIQVLLASSAGAATSCHRSETP